MLWLLESFSRAIENADTQSDKKISHLTLVLDVEELSMKQLMYKPGRIRTVYYSLNFE